MASIRVDDISFSQLYWNKSKVVMQQSVEMFWVYNILIGNRILTTIFLFGWLRFFTALYVCTCGTTFILYDKYSSHTNSPVTILSFA